MADFVYKVGVPSAIAIYLIYVLASGLSADIKGVKDALISHQSQSSDMIRQWEAVRIQSDRQLYVMQRICINSARTNTERESCLAH